MEIVLQGSILQRKAWDRVSGLLLSGGFKKVGGEGVVLTIFFKGFLFLQNSKF